MFRLTVQEKLQGSRIMDIYLIKDLIKQSLYDYGRHFTQYFAIHGIPWYKGFPRDIRRFCEQKGDLYIEFMAMSEAKEEKKMKLKAK